MHLILRTGKLIGPFWSQLILLAAGLLLSLSPTATWSQATGAGPALTSVTASTAVPGASIVRGIESLP